MDALKSNYSLAYKIPLLSVIVAILIAVPLRVYQYIKLINPETGFYDKKDITISILYTVLALGIALPIVFSYIHNKSIPVIDITKNSKPYSIVTFIMAFGALIDTFGLFGDFMNLVNNAPRYLSMSDLLENISAQGGSLLLIQAVFAMVSSFYFVVSALTVINKDTKKLQFKILALAPVVWCVFRLLFRFKRTIAFVNVSDLLIELFAIVFAMVFFLALAQIRANIDADNIFWKLFAYGLPAAMFAVVCFVPKLILIITGKSELVNPMHEINFSDITIAVYAMYICISSVKAPVKRED